MRVTHLPFSVMHRFTRLFIELDSTTRTSEKLAALENYFRSVPPEDGAWALTLLVGKRPRRAISHTEMRRAVSQRAGIPMWLISECHDTVGDLSETLALLLPASDRCSLRPLSRVFDEWLTPLRSSDERSRAALLNEAWDELDTRQRLVFHKLISGSFRVGVQRRLVVRALANITALDPAIIEHRLNAPWKPTPDNFRRILSPEGDASDPAAPYPFFLATPIRPNADDPISEDVAWIEHHLAHPADWLAEWKWDGIRAQLINRPGLTMLWSRGEEHITGAFPELRALGMVLPPHTVIDGEIVAWHDNRPLPFSDLQRRLNRKQRELMLFDDVPVRFLAYDLLEFRGIDLRDLPTTERRRKLESLCSTLPDQESLTLSPTIDFGSWQDLADKRATSRERGVEGIMLKRKAAPYRAGRSRGDWWKWKIDPDTIDAVLVYAQRGSGKRASLFTDYTFALWDDNELVPVTKAYSGLTDEEIRRVDDFIKKHTTGRQGPIRMVEPRLVFEIAFEGLRESDRHRSGIALRFPRMHRWRTDKSPSDADTLATLRAMLPRSIDA